MSLLLSMAFVLASTPPIPESRSNCHDSLDVAIFTSPRHASSKQTLNIIVASEYDFPNAIIAIRDPDGVTHELESWQSSGEPYGWVAHVAAPKPGTWRAVLATGDTIHACQSVQVRLRAGRAPRVTPEEDPVWDSRLRWERDTENLFSIWVEHLFDVPIEEEPTWRPLHVVLRQPERNFLYNHWNLKEDTKKGLYLNLTVPIFRTFYGATFRGNGGCHSDFAHVVEALKNAHQHAATSTAI